MRVYLDLLRREKDVRRAYLAQRAVAVSGGIVLLHAGPWWLATRGLRRPVVLPITATSGET